MHLNEELTKAEEKATKMQEEMERMSAELDLCAKVHYFLFSCSRSM